MSNKIGMDLLGMEELQKEMQQLGTKGSSVENKALKLAGGHLAKVMYTEAPERTGALKESIKVSGIKTSKGKKRVEVGPTVYYAPMLERGTSKMPADPFMARSYNSSKKDLQNIIISEIKKGLGLK